MCKAWFAQPDGIALPMYGCPLSLEEGVTCQVSKGCSSSSHDLIHVRFALCLEQPTVLGKNMEPEVCGSYRLDIVRQDD